MLATLVDKAFNEDDWVFEEKYDGIRVLVYKEGRRVSLLSRNDIDRTKNFPEIVASIAHLKQSALLLDGEIVVFDRSRVSRFQLLQQGKGHAFYAIFDCLYADGTDLRKKPLSERRKMLEKVVPANDILLLSRRLSALTNDYLRIIVTTRQISSSESRLPQAGIAVFRIPCFTIQKVSLSE